jgi:hypothetical protein
MKTYLFNDSDTFNFSIEAYSFKGALMKARDIFGIRAPMRKYQECGNGISYRASSTGYVCALFLAN